MDNQESIFQVRSVDVRILKPLPAKIVVFADGIAASSGWTDGRLVPADEPTTEDTVKLLFVATPPQCPDTQVLTPLRAEPYVILFSETIRAIEVISATNRIRVEVDASAAFDSVEAFNHAMVGEGEVQVAEAAAPLLANEFEVANASTSVRYTVANIAGEPLLHYNDRVFSGREVTLTPTPLGLLVQAVIEAVADDDTTSFSLLVPPVLLRDTQDEAKVELLGLTAVHRATIAGPPLGQSIRYSSEPLSGKARFTVS